MAPQDQQGSREGVTNEDVSAPEFLRWLFSAFKEMAGRFPASNTRRWPCLVQAAKLDALSAMRIASMACDVILAPLQTA